MTTILAIYIRFTKTADKKENTLSKGLKMMTFFGFANHSANAPVVSGRPLYVTRWMILLVLLLAMTSVCAANQRDQAAENQIHNQLKRIAPEAVDYFITATQALDRGENEIARDNYKRVLVYAPDFVPALRRLSYVVEDTEEALQLARRAYDLDGHYYNTMSVVRALLMQDKVDAAETMRYVKRLMEQAPEDVDTQSLICQAALQLDRKDLLKKAVAALRRLAPDGLATHYYAGIEAAIDERWSEAEGEILKAKAVGLDAIAAEALLEKTGIRSKARRWRLLTDAAYGLVVWAAGLVLLLATGIILSKLTLFAVEKGSGRVQIQSKGGMYLIRKLYAAILGLTSAYFYISIPVVILLVIAAGGGAIYSFFLLGHIPVKLVFIIAVVVCVSVYGMIKSLFMRVKEEDPGPRLKPDDAPTFFKALQEVASRIDAPMVDRVFVVQDASAAVFERGPFWQRLRGKTEKCLILGLGLLNGITQVQLKSILAHEFGHISNRDTAGGSIALHVRRTIFASARAMAEGGAATWYNPAWLFLNAFHRIFLRVSQGASRLQEVLADQWAAMAYGSRSFVEGLRHAIKRSIEYELVSDIEINQAIRDRRHLNNLYTLKVPEHWPESEGDRNGDENDNKAANAKMDLTPAEKVETALNEATKEPTSPFDSHPAPMQRIRWVEALKNVPDVGDDGRPAWDLLENAAALQEMLTSHIDARVQAYIENHLDDTQT
jgi:Zn-dependent protease with chaperone function